MPRIRKKTSKRGTTARRAKIKHKVSESRKKSRKAAKGDPTWKSKKSKDPGIPNNFPYKDQILAEIAEERRQAAETKARRKEEKRQLREQQKVALDTGKDDSHDQDSDGAEGEVGGFTGVATLAGPTKGSSKSTRDAPATNGSSGSAPATTTETNGAPPLFNPDLPHLAAVLDKADVVIEVLDARDPFSCRSHALEARVASKEGQKLLLVLNKIDACPREPTAAWAAHLRSEYPTLLTRAASSFLPPPVAHDATKGKGKRNEPLDDGWGLDAVSNLLEHWSQEKKGEGPLHVAVVGLTNSGKSAFINSLARKPILDIYTPSSSINNPTTTPHALEVTLELNGVSILFIDTPGLAWQYSEEAPPEEKERRRARDVLLRNRGRIDRLKDPLPALSYIVSRAETEDLMVFYGLPAFAKGNVDAFLMGVARAQGLIKKGGKLDLAAAARIVLRDWSTGKLSRYTVPPSVSNPGTAAKADGVSPVLVKIYEGDGALLDKLLPRKEMRRTHDLVRLSSERIDDRKLALDTPWVNTDSVNDSDADDDNGDASELESEVGAEEIGSGADGSGDSEEDADGAGHLGAVESDEAEDDENDVLGSSSASARKRKRPQRSSLAPSSKSQSDPTRPRKKVAFAPTTFVKATSNSTRLSFSSGPSPYKKSNAKAPAGTKPPPPPSRTRKSAANAPPPPTAQKRKPKAGEDSDDAYDFSKFF